MNKYYKELEEARTKVRVKAWAWDSAWASYSASNSDSYSASNSDSYSASNSASASARVAKDETKELNYQIDLVLKEL